MFGWLFKKTKPSNSLPTVKFDSFQVSDEIEEKLLADLKAIPEIRAADFDRIYDAAHTAISRGRDAAHLSNALLTIDGVTKKRAGAIAIHILNRSTVRMNCNRQQSLGITHGKWRFSNAPCGDAEMTALHKSLDGRKFKLDEGVVVKGRRIWPGSEEGCRCTHSSIIPGLKE